MTIPNANWNHWTQEDEIRLGTAIDRGLNDVEEPITEKLMHYLSPIGLASPSYCGCALGIGLTGIYRDPGIAYAHWDTAQSKAIEEVSGTHWEPFILAMSRFFEVPYRLANSVSAAHASEKGTAQMLADSLIAGRFRDEYGPYDG